MSLSKLVGKHASMLAALHQVVLFATSNAPVLITGETGTGKELFAHAIHSMSKRQSAPFIPLDCGALPEQLAENELFGHSRGAFTDAHTDQKGLAAMAEGGTLFLDEVDALSLPNQTKLLRLLQEGTYRALGADRFTRANVRVIAASNKCIEDCVQQGQFREDLYFRLNVLRLQLPPLRERRGDVALLAQHFLDNECGNRGAAKKSFSPAALRKLESYDWPGNARELLNVVQRATVCCPGRQIMAKDILLTNEVTRLGPVSADDTFRSAKQQAIARFERSYVEQLLARHQGNITQAAREAGKERRSFGRLVKKYAAAGLIPGHQGKKAG
jgi:DNA-binding NtrC family response regulator